MVESVVSTFPGTPRVAGVHVQWEWHREIVQCARQRGEIARRRHPVMRCGSSTSSLRALNLNALNTSRIDHR